MSAVRANDRYEVEVIGTPDPPQSQYMVLNLVHDFEARVSLWMLARNYDRAGQPARATEVRRMLKETEQAHAEAMKAKNPKEKGKKTAAEKKDRRA